MATNTDKIVSAYIDRLKVVYPWAQGANGETAQRRGLEMAEDAARNACAGKLKLEGDAWTYALKAAGFSGHYTMRALASFCGEG